MRTDELDFELPAELIAQAPVAERAASRLLHYRRDTREIVHRRFAELPGLLRRGDLLVFNDAKVVPARFTLRKGSGGLIEGLYLGNEVGGLWRVMLKNLGPNAMGKKLVFADAEEVGVEVVGQGEGGIYRVRVEGGGTALELLSRVGRMPLPPYIKRERHHDERDEFDKERYQTVYARTPGSVAAPTAGLHFTEEVMRGLEERGVEKTFVTLHVGLGTFKPVTSDTLEGHAMHTEAYSISREAAEALNRAKREGRRIIAVGTTATRVLESQEGGTEARRHGGTKGGEAEGRGEGPFVERQGETGIFIYPPYEWKHVSAMVTNFHLPRSTLIALVAAMVGLEEQRRIYREAIGERYRFFSYGDAMFVE